REEIKGLVDALLRVDRLGAEELVVRALEQGESFNTVDRLIVPALEEIGRGWEAGTVALAQVYMSSKVCEELMKRFLPETAAQQSEHPGIAFALLEDYHALGKMIVSTALRAEGYTIKDYGRLSVEELASRVCEDSVKVLLISTLMLRSALRINKVKQLLEQAGSSVKIIVGGAPFRFDPLLWKEVGADAMGANAAEAITAVAACLEEQEKSDSG
ncbi:MAG: cobalamin-dependent protein, partial [Candidatus Electrothrix sp.]